MKNKEGFTLIELLAVIVILSTLALIVGFGVSKVIKGAKTDLNDTQIAAITEAAKIWSVENMDSLPSSDCSYISIQTLKDAGLFNDMKDLKINPALNDLYVTVCKVSDDGINNYSYEMFNENAWSDCFEYTEADTITLTGYKQSVLRNGSEIQCPENIILPSKINNKKVTAVAHRAFEQTQHLNSVIISSTIQEIGDSAFNNSEFESINFSMAKELTTIGEYAFSGNYITYVDFSKATKLTTIGYGAFENNDITSISFPPSITKINGETFMNNNIFELNIPVGVTEIGTSAFEYCNIHKLTLPYTLKKIQSGAFRDNFIYNLNLPDLEYISSFAFFNNEIEEIHIRDSIIEIGNNAFDENHLRGVLIESSYNESFINNHQFGSFNVDNIQWNNG